MPQLYKILYENSAQNFCSEFYKVHKCKAQAIIRGLVSIGVCCIAKIVWLTKGCKWGEEAELLYLSSPFFTLYLVDYALLTQLLM